MNDYCSYFQTPLRMYKIRNCKFLIITMLCVKHIINKISIVMYECYPKCSMQWHTTDKNILNK